MESNRNTSPDTEDEKIEEKSEVFESLTKEMDLLFIDGRNEQSQKRKIIILVPFFELSREEFDKKNKPSNKLVKINGFDFHVRKNRENDGLITYEHYREVMDDLKNTKGAAYKRAIEKSYRKINEEVEIIGPMTLPTSEDDLKKLQTTFKNLQPRDQLYITAHGNKDLIASRPFAFYVKNLVDCLIKLKLPNERVLVAIYACNSGDIDMPDFDKGFAENVYHGLRIRGREKVCLVGINGYLYGTHHFGVFAKKEDNETSRRILMDKHGQSAFASPITLEMMSERANAKGRFFTGNRDRSNALEARKKLEIKPIPFNLDSEKGEEDEQDNPKQTSSEMSKTNIKNAKPTKKQTAKKNTVSQPATTFPPATNDPQVTTATNDPQMQTVERRVTRSMTRNKQ